MLKDIQLKPFEKLLDSLRNHPNLNKNDGGVSLTPERLIVRRHSDILVLGVKQGNKVRRFYIKRPRLKKDTTEDRTKLFEKVRREYETAKLVYENFEEFSQFSVLIPIAYFDEELALVTEECPGKTLRSLLPNWYNLFNAKKKVNLAAPYCRLAGEWLKHFHNLDSKNMRPSIPMDTISNGINIRFQKLKSFENILDSRLEEKIREYVEMAKKSKNETELKATIMHGDFCPANMLIAGKKLTVIDFATAGVGSIYHDLSHFLFHLNGLERYQIIHQDQIFKLKQEFLEGYGNPEINDLNIISLMGIYHSVCRLLSIAKKYQTSTYRDKVAITWQLHYHMSTLKKAVKLGHEN